jgi:hypothetical protein
MKTLALAALVATLVLGASCTQSRHALDPTSLPAEQRANFAVFANRCSKCHSLARPLESGIEDDSYWVLYVAKMRRQPGSGITAIDAPPILSFLHFYSAEQRRRRQATTFPIEPSPPTPGTGLAPAPSEPAPADGTDGGAP